MADKLSYGDAGRLAVEAGWKDEKQASIAVAIAIAESQLNPSATNFRPPDLSYGLWQINMLGKLGPERRQKYGLKSNEDLLDPKVNARVAFGIYTDAGNKFTDWSTYLNRTYFMYYSGANFGVREAINRPINYDEPDLLSGLKDTLDGSLGGLNDIAGFLTNRDNWLRAAGILGGGILIVLAIVIILTDTILGQVIKKAAKTGKLVKKVT